MLCYYFSLEVVMQVVANNNPTKKYRSRNSWDCEPCASVKTQRMENAKFIVTNCKDRVNLQSTTAGTRISIRVTRRCSVKQVFLKISQY